ncbi:phage antirepressor [Streptococcus parauberis]|uniref:Phage antirepressor protein n=1 Tax=Streptococcus parauberis KRS-02083 TaxID=1207545 RepID=A0ABP2T0R5_9STRE|nr:phage antirepressor [Streptococcus parauberis]EMG26289.1 Phage antirepressor protein [Streptococcus parauberis KRS-02083]QBX18135.1 antirepressor protein [Streptococcus phage Javan393]WEM65776.1 phage antirepressor [Streptococcus parauberis]WOF47656.1 phage antirepressor [Streptococcus parauberis]
MQEIYNFKGQEVRTVTINNEPYFVGKDVADILGYSNSRDALSKHVDSDDKLTSQIATAGQNRNQTIINESGLYSLILSSKLPQAKEFKRWVTTEVLPTIRKHGAYLTDSKIEEVLLSPDTIINLATQLKEERQKVNSLQLELKEAQKQARYLDLIIESKGALRVSQIAQDYGMTANKLNKVLYELGVQHKVNGQWILYKRHMGKGYTDSHTFDFKDKNGYPRTNVSTTWTQKGRLFLYELLKENGYLPLIEQEDIA